MYGRMKEKTEAEKRVWTDERGIRSAEKGMGG